MTTPAVPETKTNGFAIASLVLGIGWVASLFLRIELVQWVGPILAVIFGHLALSQIKKAQGGQKGRGMAIAGLILGYYGVVFLVIFIWIPAAIGNKFSEIGQ